MGSGAAAREGNDFSSSGFPAPPLITSQCLCGHFLHSSCSGKKEKRTWAVMLLTTIGGDAMARRRRRKGSGRESGVSSPLDQQG